MAMTLTWINVIWPCSRKTSPHLFCAEGCLSSNGLAVRATQHHSAPDIDRLLWPTRHRAPWFALMASLMNLALVAGQLQTKYLNQIFVIGRGDYMELGPLLISVAVLGLVVPLAVILLFGRRV